MKINPMAAQLDALTVAQDFLAVIGSAVIVLVLLGIGVAILNAINRRDP